MEEQSPGHRVAWATAGFVCATAALVALHPALMMYLDELQLELGRHRFDLTVHAPHPPGYYGFVLLGRLVGLLAHTAPLRQVATLCGGGVAALLILGLPTRLAPTPRLLLALVAVLFVATSPLMLLFGIAGLTYLPGALLLLGVLLLCVRLRGGSPMLGLGALLGAGAGVRPEVLLIGGAIVGARLLHVRLRPEGRQPLGWVDGAWLAGGLLVGLGSWFVPMLIEVGGWQAWRSASAEMMAGNIWDRSALSRGLPKLGENLGKLTDDLVLGLGPGLALLAAALIARWRRRGDAPVRELDPLLWGGLAAAAFYGLTIYETKGYALLVIVPLFAWSLGVCGRVLPGLPGRGALIGASAAGVLAAGWLVLPGGLAADDRGTRGWFDRSEEQLIDHFEAIRTQADPARTVLVTGHGWFTLSFRHVMYYLPEYTTLQTEWDPRFAAHTDEAPWIVGRERRTWLAGPAILDPVDLLPAGGPGALLFLFPRDLSQLMHDDCRPFLQALATARGAKIAALPLGAGLAVRLEEQRVVCQLAQVPSEPQ